MHFFSSLFLISGAVSAVAAHRSNAGVHSHSHLHQRQSDGNVIVTGANGYGDGQIHARLEVSDLAANHPLQYNLLMLAMGEWQLQDSSDMTSYFQVAGIHGMPAQTWDGVGPCDSCTGPLGYCTHAMVLFPAWHRAYVALFEQQFLNVVMDIANRFTGDAKAKYLKAASFMRLPYWDWAAKADANNNVLPTLLSSPEVTVDGPNGRQTIANPFYQYHIANLTGMYYYPFYDWPNTLRYPNGNTASGASVEQSAVNALGNIQSNMQSSVYSLLTNCQDYDHFSHDGATGSTTCTNSLEGIHNTIHTTTGGPGGNGISGGHMTYLPLAAFDPIFFLHHANVDRLFALWQTLNPDSYGGSSVAVYDTWTIAQGTTLDQDSPLQPFRSSSTSFWTTTTVRDWANTFKYTYPEFVTSDGSLNAIAQYVNQLYGSSPTLTASSISRRVKNPQAAAQADVQNTQTAKRALLPSKVGLSIGGVSIEVGWRANATTSALYPTGTSSSNSSQYHNSKGAQYEYSCNVRTPRFAYNVSYTVYVFDGEPASDDSTTWLGDDNCVGSIGVLAGGHVHGDVIVQGGVSLTKHLQDKVKQGAIASMNGKHVSPYLQKNLGWKIVKEGEEIQPDSLQGYKASVWSGTSLQKGTSSLPQWSTWQPEVQATKGKAGGVQSEDEAHSEWPSNSPSSYGAGTSSAVASSPVTSSTCESSSVATDQPQSTPLQTSLPQSSVYAPVETSTPSSATSEAGPAAPVGGTAAPTGAVPSYPSSSPITPYTGDAIRASGNVLLAFSLCVLAGVLLL